jgi:hypothetical protein
MNQDSSAWVFYCYVSFGVAVLMMLAGIAMLNVDFSMRAYMVMGTVFLIGNCVTLTKTMRDQHESRRLVNRIEEAKTEKLLKEYRVDA